MIGTTLGSYRIESEVAAGGMGIVFRATDTALRRAVAIKILPPGAAADPDRRRRFVQEAQAASALNHPGIVTIYQIGREADVDYIAMELIGGRSLDRALGRPLPLADVVRIGIGVADALAAAHKAGIVHRDLKPANVMLRDAGGVKLLDFGVAKLAQPVDAAATATALATVTGVAVGTFAYMSPEQREGAPVDARSDIYSYGLLLFEMITGRRLDGAFDPALLAAAPRDLRRIVARCLRREPAERFQVMEDVRHALEDLDASADTSAAAPAAPRWMPAAFLAAGLVVLVVSGALLWRARATPGRPPLLLTRATNDSGLTTEPALSADGRLLAFASDRAGNGSLDIWVRQAAGGTPVRLTDDPADDREPTFSPDGTQIAFESDRQGGGIYVVPALGGQTRRIADQCHRPRWSPTSNRIVCWAGVNAGFLLAKADAPRVFLTTASAEEPQRLFADFAVAWAPIWSRDGAHILFLGKRAERDDPEWWIADANGASPQPTRIAESLIAAHLNPPNAVFIPEAWDAQDRILFTASLGNPNLWTIINDSVNLWRIAVDANGHAAGAPERVTTGATLDTHPSTSSDGTIAFSSIHQNVDLWSLPVEASTGRATGSAQRVTDDPAFDSYPSLSPDDRLVFASNRSGTFELWMQEGKEQTVLATDITFPGLPIISRDGTMAIYASGAPRRWFAVPTRSGARAASRRVVCQDCSVLWDLTSDNRAIVYTRDSDSSIRVRDLAGAKDTQLTAAPGDVLGRLHLSPDNRWLVMNQRTGGAIRLMIVPFTADTRVTRDRWISVAPEGMNAHHGIWSPDGRLLYFLSDQDGRVCVWAEPIDPDTGKVAGAAFPVWHFHDARRSMASLPFPLRGVALSRSRMMVSLNESAGNVWLAK